MGSPRNFSGSQAHRELGRFCGQQKMNYPKSQKLLGPMPELSRIANESGDSYQLWREQPRINGKGKHCLLFDFIIRFVQHEQRSTLSPALFLIGQVQKHGWYWERLDQSWIFRL